MGESITLPQALRKLSYNPAFIRVVRLLGLRTVGRRWYYRWARPRDNRLELRWKGVTASFVTESPEQLRAVEAGWLCDERPILEHLLGILRPGDTFYDVGSHVGIYAVFAAKVVGAAGHVIAFEPETRSYTTLQENLRMNGLANVRMFRKALGDREETANLYVGKVVGNISLIPHAIVGGNEDSCDRERVEVVRGDAFVEQERLPVPRAVKIDVEGYEYSVLRGLRNTLSQRGCEVVCCEIHPRFLPTGVTVGDVRELLRSYGFTVPPGRPGHTPFHVVASKSAGDARAGQ